MQNESRTILIPLDEWSSFVDLAMSVDTISGGPKGADGLTFVRCSMLNGRLLTVSGTVHGPFESTLANAWALTPVELWLGKTVKAMHDDDAIKNGLRERGNFIGCLVRTKRGEFVISEKFDVRPSLPSSASMLTIDQAKDYYDRHESSYFKSSHPMSHWEFFCGHPISIVEEKLSAIKAGMLYYRSGKNIARQYIRDVDRLKTLFPTVADGAKKTKAAVQLALFD